MSTLLCQSCRRSNRSTSPCPLCEGQFCKECLQTQDPLTFSFLKPPAPDLLHSAYCGPCYDEKIAPELASYEATLELAKKMYVFMKTQKKQPHVLKKAKSKIAIENCADRDETILRLAFLAAQQGFNSLMETDIVSKKVRNEGWQTTAWSGTALPAQVDAFKVDRNEASEDRYR